MKKGAQFSYSRIYRYALWRTWEEGEGHVMFIGLNPSTADEAIDDPTIRRCMGFAKALGFGGLYMLNLFAYRATNPKDLKKTSLPIGPENDDYLKMYFDPDGLTIACWGHHGTYLHRGSNVIELLGRENLSCFGITRNFGQPKHPLYLKADTKPQALSFFKKINRQSKIVNPAE